MHDEATRVEDTDLRQILGLYELLASLAPGPMITLNRIVAVAMVRGPAVALEQLDAAADDPALAGHHRVDAVRAHLLEQAGQPDAAREHYRRAAQRTLSAPEQRYLLHRATDTDRPDWDVPRADPAATRPIRDPRRSATACEGTKQPDAIPSDMRMHYLDVMRRPGAIHAICDDYRASVFIDAGQDENDQQAGRTLTMPVLAAWQDPATSCSRSTRSGFGRHGRPISARGSCRAVISSWRSSRLRSRTRSRHWSTSDGPAHRPAR